MLCAATCHGDFGPELAELVLEHHAVGAGSEEVVQGGGRAVEGEVGVGGGGGGVGGVHAGEDVVEGAEARGELGGLGAEDGVLGVDGQEALRGEPERGGHVRVLAAQVRGLRRELVQVALLAHPRPPRRLAVRQHPLGAALRHERAQLLLRSRRRRRVQCRREEARAPAPAGGSHCSCVPSAQEPPFLARDGKEKREQNSSLLLDPFFLSFFLLLVGNNLTLLTNKGLR
jgi:hypothetical protein